MYINAHKHLQYMKNHLTEAESTELKGIFPRGFASTVAKNLNDAGKKPLRAKEYSDKMVRDVLNRNAKDFNIVLALFQYKLECLQKQEGLNQVMGKIEKLSKDKTAVATVKE